MWRFPSRVNINFDRKGERWGPVCRSWTVCMSRNCLFFIGLPELKRQVHTRIQSEHRGNLLLLIDKEASRFPDRPANKANQGQSSFPLIRASETAGDNL
ncbi:hypothetical protein RchiOBHm_Chr2g0093201 [Rosa chinensis]|uniref:Uncharacterized protein n=1 Tax=Rosa chinensis TaxID=74649 RepID=A0A2P6RK85_ROSCH|nr:hypothetical protein RchiOBHm_Chr2g0093201 [Rosa chinensis]